MLYQLSHFLINKFPFAWSVVEWCNEKLFLLLYGRRLQHLYRCLNKYQTNYQVREATLDDVQAMVNFFDNQPQESFTFFQPHGFDENSIIRLIKNKSHLAFMVFDEKGIVGYFFLRCFFIGKCFLGKMVDYEHQGKGIGQMMCLKAMDIATLLKMRMFETISKDNLSSLYSTQKVLDTKIIKEMDNNYIYIEDFPKGTLK